MHQPAGRRSFALLHCLHSSTGHQVSNSPTPLDNEVAPRLLGGRGTSATSILQAVEEEVAAELPKRTLVAANEELGESRRLTCSSGSLIIP